MRKQKRFLASLLAGIMVFSGPVQVLAADGWQYEQEKWYHFTQDKKDTGWLTLGQDIWYLLDAEGVMQTGWYEDSAGHRYYLNRIGEGIEGQMRYGWYQDGQGIWYFLNTEHDGYFGKALTGWVWIDGYCYYFDDIGRMYANGQTPDGYEVDADGRWTVEGVVQNIEGKGYFSKHTHKINIGSYDSSEEFGGSGGSGNSGSSEGENSGEGGNNGSDPGEGIYENYNKKTYNTLDHVKTFDNTTQQGQEELNSLENSMLDIWVSDMAKSAEDSITEDDIQEIQLLVTNESPIYQYILDGSIEEGDVIHIPVSDENDLPLTFVYRSHDDDFDGEGSYDPDATEVIHTEEATMRQLLSDEIQYTAGGVNAESPLAFSWSFQYAGTNWEDTEAANAVMTRLYETATDSNAEKDADSYETASDSNAVNTASASNAAKENSAAVLSRSASAVRSGEQFKVSFNNDEKTGKLNLELSANCVIYDGDGNTDTKDDQVKLSGGYEIREFYPQMVIDWPLLEGHLLDPWPNQIMAKVSCEDEMNLGLEYSGRVDFKDIVKAINDANMAHSNEYKIAFFKLQGVDFSKSAVLWAGGINIGTGQIQLNMRSLQQYSTIMPFSPTVLVMLLLDVDGNITAKVSADISKESYRELGINYQEKGYNGVGGTPEQNQGEENFEIGNHVVNVYAKEWTSKTDSSPSGYTVCVKGEGTAELDMSLNMGIGLMMAGLVPAAAKAGIGVDANMDGSGEILMNPAGISGQLDGNASLEIYAKAQALAKLKLSPLPGIDISPEWKWSILKKELSGEELSAVRFSSKLQEYFEADYDELSAQFKQKPKSGYLNKTAEVIAFFNDEPMSTGRIPQDDADICISYIRPISKEHLIYDITGGVRKDEGTYDILAGISYLLEGLEDDTTWGDVLDQTGITGEFTTGDKYSEIPSFIFEKEGYRYWVDFYSLAVEDGNYYDPDSNAGRERIEELVRKEKVKNNQVTVWVSPTEACTNINVYQNVQLQMGFGEKLESCIVPSGEQWQEVIKGNRYIGLYTSGARAISFEFQVEPVSPGVDTITIEYSSQKKEQKIYPGTNTMTFSLDDDTYSTTMLGISIDGPEEIYIRNAVLDPQ